MTPRTTRPTRSNTRPTRRGRPPGASNATAGEAPGAIRADSLYTLRELCKRLGLGSKSWRTLRDTGVPVRRVGKQAFVLGEDLLDHFRRLPAEIATSGDDSGGPEQ